MTDTEQISFRRTLELGELFSPLILLFIVISLAQHNVDQWLQKTLQNNEQINTTDNDELLTNQLITYFHNEIDVFEKTLLSPVLNEHLNNLFEQRINSIKTILQEKKSHQKIIRDIDQQLIELDQKIDAIKNNPEKEDVLKKLYQYKEKFNQIKEREDSEIQPILGTRLELAIRTLDADLQMIEQTLDKKPVTDTAPATSLISRKISRQPLQSIESRTLDKMTLIQKNLSDISMDIQDYQKKIDEKNVSEDLLKKDMCNKFQPDL